MELYPSKHALTTMVARGVTWPEVVEACRNPQVIEPHKGCHRYVRDGLVVVVARDGVVVTVLLRTPTQWTDDDARERRNA